MGILEKFHRDADLYFLLSSNRFEADFDVIWVGAYQGEKFSGMFSSKQGFRLSGHERLGFVGQGQRFGSFEDVSARTSEMQGIIRDIFF